MQRVLCCACNEQLTTCEKCRKWHCRIHILSHITSSCAGAITYHLVHNLVSFFWLSEQKSSMCMDVRGLYQTFLNLFEPAAMAGTPKTPCNKTHRDTSRLTGWSSTSLITSMMILIPLHSHNLKHALTLITSNLMY